MYVRLAFAVAAHLEPEILIVDEVLAVGDAAFQKKCLGKMEDVAEKEGRTVLFVSHNMNMVAALCSRGCLLSHGKLLSQGTSQEVVNQYIESTISISSESLEHRKDRQGDGTARFISIQISSDSKDDTIFCDSKLEITIEYVSPEILKNTTFAIGIFDISNVEIYFLDSDSTQDLPNIMPSKGRIKCYIDPINLTPGKCYINVALVKGGLLEGGAMIDYVQNAISFNVEPKLFYKSGKLPPRSWSMCLIKHKWTLA